PGLRSAWLPVLVLALVAGCARGPVQRDGGYLPGDGPGDRPVHELAALPDAQPRVEAFRPATLRPYVVEGRRFVPMTADDPWQETGVASWYGRGFHGRPTAIGEPFDMYEMTAAHPTMPLPSYARVRHLGNGREVVVRVNDRGPFRRGRVIDL